MLQCKQVTVQFAATSKAAGFATRVLQLTTQKA
jgi:hypothetical protein